MKLLFFISILFSCVSYASIECENGSMLQAYMKNGTLFHDSTRAEAIPLTQVIYASYAQTAGVGQNEVVYNDEVDYKHVVGTPYAELVERRLSELYPTKSNQLIESCYAKGIKEYPKVREDFYVNPAPRDYIVNDLVSANILIRDCICGY